MLIHKQKLYTCLKFKNSVQFKNFDSKLDERDLGSAFTDSVLVFVLPGSSVVTNRTRSGMINNTRKPN
jgi:hypothetical protein